VVDHVRAILPKEFKHAELELNHERRLVKVDVICKVFVEVLDEVFHLWKERFEGREDGDVVADCFLLVLVGKSLFLDEVHELVFELSAARGEFEFRTMSPELCTVGLVCYHL